MPKAFDENIEDIARKRFHVPQEEKVSCSDKKIIQNIGELMKV